MWVIIENLRCALKEFSGIAGCFIAVCIRAHKNDNR